MSTIQNNQTKQPATSYNRNVLKKDSAGAASTPQAAPVLDTFDSRSVGSPSSIGTAVTAPEIPQKISLKRKVVVRGSIAAAGATVLGFAGYGIYAAAPHIATGITTAVAIPAVHFIGIGVAATLAAVLVGFGIYLAVKKFKAWRNPAPAEAKPTPVQEKAPQSLSKENVARIKSPSPEDFDTLTAWVNTGDLAPQQQPVAKTERWKLTPSKVQDLAEALKVEDAKKKAAQADQNTEAETQAKRIADEQAKADAARSARGPAPKNRFARFALNNGPKTDDIQRSAADNWRGLTERFDNDEGTANQWKTFYAKYVIDYQNATSSGQKQEIFQELNQHAAVFPETKDQETFEAALKGLAPLAETWNRTHAGR